VSPPAASLADDLPAAVVPAPSENFSALGLEDSDSQRHEPVLPQ